MTLLPWAARADAVAAYHYTILRDGDPIGTHQVTVTPEGSEFKVESQTDVDVTFGPLILYHLDHQRQEFWRDGELEEMTAHTNKNGDVYNIEITREPDGYKRVVNGRTDRFAPSMKVLTLWHEDLFRYNTFVSPMEDKVYRISVNFVGSEKFDLLGKSVNAFVYRLSGDTDREIWYDAEGDVMKVKLLDHSSDIEYVLTSMDGEIQQAAHGIQLGFGPHLPITRLVARR